jgi:hypothetical protein
MNEDDLRRLSDERVADRWRNSYAAVEALSRVADREHYRASIDAMVQASQELHWNLDHFGRSMHREFAEVRREIADTQAMITVSNSALERRVSVLEGSTH